MKFGYYLTSFAMRNICNNYELWMFIFLRSTGELIWTVDLRERERKKFPTVGRLNREINSSYMDAGKLVLSILTTNTSTNPERVYLTKATNFEIFNKIQFLFQIFIFVKLQVMPTTSLFVAIQIILHYTKLCSKYTHVLIWKSFKGMAKCRSFGIRNFL